MLIDLHTHTRRYSPCSILDPPELVERACQERLDGIVLTEHNHVWSGEEIKKLAAGSSEDILILRGMEVDTSFSHVLIYGYYEPISFNISPEELEKLIHSHGGALVLAHPFRWGLNPYEGISRDEIRDFFLNFDAIEVFNSNCSEESIRQGWDMARSMGLKTAGGSDAHSSKMVGIYCTRFFDRVTSENDLVQALRSGRFVPSSVIPDNPVLSCLFNDRDP
jgi:hypothetical protein